MTESSASVGDKPLVHRPGRLSRRESRLAFGMTLPSVFIVMAIVLFPLLATFWISVKPIELADLRAPEVRTREQVRGDVTRPSATKSSFATNCAIPAATRRCWLLRLKILCQPGLTALALDPRCTLDGEGLLFCVLGDFDAGQSETLDIPVRSTQAFIDNPVSAKDSDVVVPG